MSKAKEITSKRIVSPIRTVGKSMSMPKLFLVGLVSLLSALPLPSLPDSGIMAYAQQQAQSIDPWSDALRTAQSKVEAAMAHGAFGHGVPGLHTLTTSDILLVFGVGAIGCVMTYGITPLLMQHREKIKMNQLVTKATSTA